MKLDLVVWTLAIITTLCVSLTVAIIALSIIIKLVEIS